MGPGQIGNYATEKWERKAVIVWAQPGKSGNAMEAGSWGAAPERIFPEP